MFENIYQKINELLNSHHKIVIAIDGQAASGKTTLAKELSAYYHAPIIKMDDYFLRPEQRSQERLVEVGGHIDYERFEVEVINHLEDSLIHVKPYDCQLVSFLAEQTVDFSHLLIIEGAYSMRLPWNDAYHLKIVLTIDEALQIERIKLRNPTMLDRFIREWIPKENLYLSKHCVIERADIRIHIGKS